MLSIAGKTFTSRMLLGTAQYPSPQVLSDAIEASGAEIITVALRRQLNQKSNNHFFDIIKKLNRQLLPNTAGCHSAKEAINTAQMARELFETNWIKLEVIGDDYSLLPNVFELVEAAKELNKQGFEMLPYCTDDLFVCEKLLESGCKVLMPLASPIGTARGANNPYALQQLRDRFSDVTLIVDAGIGKPSHATQVMEYGFDGVLLNTAVSGATDPIAMASAFARAIEAGRLGYEAGMVLSSDSARASTPLIDRPFWNDQHA